MSPDVLKNHVLSLHVPLTPDECEQIAWLAQAKRAALLNLPPPRRPGIWNWFQRVWFALRRTVVDRRAFAREIKRLSYRINQLEGSLIENRIAIPDEERV